MAKQQHGTIRLLTIFNFRPPSEECAGFFCRLLLCLSVMLMPAPAQAQNTGVQELLNRVDRFQRELSTLQRQVYQGDVSPPSALLPPTPPASDPRNAARISIRVTQLEKELQKLTGRVEKIGFRAQKIETRLEKLIADMDQRLATLEGSAQSGAALRGASPGANADLTLWPPAAVQPTPPTAPQTNKSRVLSSARGRAPRILGTIPKNLAVSSPDGAVNVAPQASKSAPVLPAGTPKEQYDYALSLMLKQQDFARAETALKAFIQINPKDGLAENAQYWLGETFYVRKNYQDAAFAFAEGFQKFPTGKKAPDSLLKLGMSLDRLEKRREACMAYSRLLSTFPKADARLKTRVQRERSRSKCR
ncbi:MAG: tol-pal system protein YbgF [Rhodospirillaceae bacterium]|nr:tol-pal system protein YbgF [Rhodospirillaceae bacterium]